MEEIDLFAIVGRAPTQEFDQTYDQVGDGQIEIRPAPDATFQQGCHAMLIDLIRRIGAGEITQFSFTATDTKGRVLNGVTADW